MGLNPSSSTSTPTIVQERSAPGGTWAAAGDTEAAAAQILPSVVQVRAGWGSGSGFVMDDRGHVLTNHHVIAGARDVSLVLSDDRRVPATVIGSDAEDDIAVPGGLNRSTHHGWSHGRREGGASLDLSVDGRTGDAEELGQLGLGVLTSPVQGE